MLCIPPDDSLNHHFHDMKIYAQYVWNKQHLYQNSKYETSSQEEDKMLIKSFKSSKHSHSRVAQQVA